MSNIAQSLTRNGAPIDAKQQEAKPSRLDSFLLSSSSFGRSATSVAILPREFLISLGLVSIAVPSIANESATGVADTCPWVGRADVVFARSNAY
jgi:hypothetical protein